MRARRARWTGTSLLALGVAFAWSGAAMAQAESATRPDTGATGELEAIYRARADSARLRFTEADVRFMAGMIHHHAQAVVMGRLASTHGASPSLQTLAARIINSQEDEIATMQRWLRDRRQPVPEVQIEGANLMVHCPIPAPFTHGAGHPMHMPEMLAPDQMRELGHARGPEFDRLFLAYMIQHHQGAVTMVHDLFGTDGAGQDETVFKFASDVQVDQRTEIARMERMLSALPADAGA